MKSKFKFFLTIIVFLFHLNVSGQQNSSVNPQFIHPSLGFGFKGGFVINNMDRFGPYNSWETGASFTNESRVSGIFGGFVYYRPLRFLKVQVEFIQSGYGGLFKKVVPGYSKMNFGTTGGRAQDNNYYWMDYYEMTFVEIPVVTRFYANSKKKISPYAELGASYGSLISANQSYNSFTPSGSFIFKTLNESWHNEDIKDITENYVWNYILGFGIEFWANQLFSLGVDCRLTSSFTRIFKYDIIEVYDSNSLKWSKYDMVSHYHNFSIGFHAAFNLKTNKEAAK